MANNGPDWSRWLLLQQLYSNYFQLAVVELIPRKPRPGNRASISLSQSNGDKAELTINLTMIHDMG